MTDRLDRIEAILANVAEQQQANTEKIQSVTKLVESNARAIQANAEAARVDRERQAQEAAAFRQEIADGFTETRQRLENLGADTMRDLMTIAQESDEADRETRARMQNLIDESKENIRQHAVFQERFNNTLARIDQSLANISGLLQ